LRQFADFVAALDRNWLRIGLGLDSLGTGNELAETRNDARRSDRADADPEPSGRAKQRETQIRIQAAAVRGRRSSNGWIDRRDRDESGRGQDQRLVQICKPQRSLAGLLVFARNSRCQRRIPDRQKLFQASAQIFEDAADPRELSTVVGIVASVMGGLAQQRIACRHHLAHFVRELSYRSSCRRLFDRCQALRP
jgi:hypothetical protein